MTCPVCGAKNDSGAVFCYRCGTALNPSNPAATGPTRRLKQGNLPEAPADRGFTRPADDFHARVYDEPAPLISGRNAYSEPSASTPQYTPPAQYGALVQSFGAMSILAVVALILALASFVGTFPITAIPALVLGYIARKEIRAAGGRLAGEGIAQAAILVAWLNVLLTMVILCVVYIILGTTIGEILSRIL